jgi:hypothetical protein
MLLLVAIMARIHNMTEFHFTKFSIAPAKLLVTGCLYGFKSFFSEDLDEMIFTKSTASEIEKN